MALTINQKKFLRGLAHHLNPVILVGSKGITEGLLAELDSTLSHHELVKVKINAGDRDERKAAIDEMVAATGAELVQTIGKVCVLYRPNPDKKPADRIQLPKN